MEIKEVVIMYNEKEFLNTITSIEQSETSELLIAKVKLLFLRAKFFCLMTSKLKQVLTFCLDRDMVLFTNKKHHNNFNAIL